LSSSCMTTPPHSSQRTTEAITTMEYKLLSLILPIAPYTTLLLLSFLAPLKDALQGRHLVDDDKLKHSTCQELQHFRREFYRTGIWHLIQRWKGVLIIKETSWKNNLDFVKNVPIICKFHCNTVESRSIVFEGDGENKR